MGVTDLLLRAGKPIFTLPGKKKSLFFSQLAEKKTVQTFADNILFTIFMAY
jgi:hypothetical protein